MKKIFSFFIIVCVFISLFALPVNGAATATASASSSSVLVGSTVTVTFKFSADKLIGAAEPRITYNPKVFSFQALKQGGSSNKNGNETIMISYFDNNGVGVSTYVVEAEFKAIAVGEGIFKIDFPSLGLYSAESEYLGSPQKSVTVSVKEESKSNNANLSSLTGPSGCTLVPKFSKDVTSYTCTVPYSVTKFPMDWTTEDKDATTSVTALQTLKVGENSRTVTVTAPDGTQKKYTVKVIREQQKVTPTPSAKPTSEATPTASPKPTNEPIIAVIDGKNYNVKSVITLQLPENFNKESYTYDSKEIETAVLGNVCLVQLFDGTSDSFFVYDKAEQKFMPYRTVKVTENKLTVLDKKPELSIELKEEHLVIGDGEYISWTNEKFGEGYYLLNVMNNDGKTYPALYCKEDGSIQKLSASLLGIDASLVHKTPVPGIDATPVVSTPENLATEVPKGGFFKNIPFQYIGIAICIVLFIAIVIIVIVIIVGNNKEKKNQHDWGFEGTTGYDFSVDDAESNTQQTEDDDFE